MVFWNRVCPIYGNWGGPGWSGGAYPKDPKDTVWEIRATDSLDALFKEHDRAYQRAIVAFRADVITRAEMHEAWEAADRVLVKRVGALSMNPRKWDEPPESVWYAFTYRYLVLGSFYPKIWIF